MGLWIFADLNQDSRDELIHSGREVQSINHLYVSDSSLKVISQINTREQIRTAKVLKHPGDNKTYLFFSNNNGKQVFLNAALYEWTNPLQRTDIGFESIDRTDKYIDNPDIEWFGMLSPHLIDDIDADGKYELICLAYDTFMANPRGVVVYDFDSRQIKWRLDLPTVAYSLLVDDFDGDGAKELLFANMAFKNTTEVKHGIDDANGWLLMIDAKGNIQHHQKLYSGYGGVFLSAKDIDADGKVEVFKVESTWGSEDHKNSVEIMHWDGKRFRSLRKYEVESSLVRSHQNFFVEADQSGTYRIFIPCLTRGLIVLDEKLNEVQSEFTDTVQYIYQSGDLTGDRKTEVLLQTENGDFVVCDYNAKVLARIANPYPEETSLSAAIINTGFGQKRQVAIISPMQIRFYSISPLPWQQILYSFLKHHRKLINLIAIIIILGMLIYVFRFQSLFYRTINQIACGVIMMKNTHRILYLNQYMRLLLQEDGKKLKNRDLELLAPQLYKQLCVYATDYSHSSQRKIELSLAGETQSYELSINRAGILLVRYIIILKPIICEVKEINDKMAWADLARRLSHHVRRHISNMLLALDPLEEDLNPETQNRHCLEVLKSEINQIKVFTHAFQRFTELKDYQLKAQDIIPSLERVISRILLPSQVNVIRDWSLKSVYAYIEPIRFEEALTNLITNALDAMPSGGNLQIGVKEFPLHDVDGNNLTVLIEIEDSGGGIPEKYLEEIWQPFFTTKQSGTGIGLPETKKTIESMQGKISIQSEVGVGTLVSIWLKGGSNG